MFYTRVAMSRIDKKIILFLFSASFLCMVVLDGIAYTFGFLLTPLVEHFQSDRNLSYCFNNKFQFKRKGKEMSFCNKLKLSNSYISATGWCKPLIFQTYIIWPNNIHSLKYKRSTTFGWKDIAIRKFEFVTKSQFLCNKLWLDDFKNRFYMFRTMSRDFLNRFCEV